MARTGRRVADGLPGSIIPAPLTNTSASQLLYSSAGSALGSEPISFSLSAFVGEAGVVLVKWSAAASDTPTASANRETDSVHIIGTQIGKVQRSGHHASSSLITITESADGNISIANAGGTPYIKSISVLSYSGGGETGSGGASDFVSLSDTPDSLTDEAGRILAVSMDESGLSFIDAPTGMTDLSSYVTMTALTTALTSSLVEDETMVSNRNSNFNVPTGIYADPSGQIFFPLGLSRSGILNVSVNAGDRIFISGDYLITQTSDGGGFAAAVTRVRLTGIFPDLIDSNGVFTVFDADLGTGIFDLTQGSRRKFGPIEIPQNIRDEMTAADITTQRMILYLKIDTSNRGCTKTSQCVCKLYCQYGRSAPR